MSKIRIRNGFSDRNKIDEIPKELQISEFSEETRIVIKNKFLALQSEWDSYFTGLDNSGFRNMISIKYATEIFNIPTDDARCNYATMINEISSIIINGEYHEVLTILEYLANTIVVWDTTYVSPYSYQTKSVRRDLTKVFNKLFEDEFIGYRFVDKEIISITNNQEVEEIKKSLSTVYEEKVNSHIKKAIKFLSETGNKDYKNSIKESISAVEGLVNMIKDDNIKDATLGKVINQISKTHPIHESLKQAIEKLYGFASDEAGIRHENDKEEKPINFEEAKFILITCSAIINYLIAVLE